MALLYDAHLQPSKLELLAAWVPRQSWATGVPGSELTVLGAYRFDDPAGEVGIETHLLGGADGSVLQVPVTYRSEPLPGADPALIGTSDHSVLGRRYVYDGWADPVCLQAFATAMFTGGVQADLDVAVEAEDGAADDQPRTRRREATTLVQGSGTASLSPALDASGRLPVERLDSDPALSVVRYPNVDLTLLRRIAAGLDADGQDPEAGATDADVTLLGSWPGQDTATLLAYARRSL